ncbi:MAG: beta-1,6-N-acetylglucosaminyltransferase [Culicoidibacterales bacterium]
MKIAYCIICHKNSNVLEYTAKTLSETDYVYIHVDKKTNLENFENLFNVKNVEFIQNREDVKWGEYSQIQATLNLFEATKEKQIDYIFLLSGDDIPLFDNDHVFKTFLKKNDKKEYIGISLNESAKQEVINKRVMYNYGSIYYKKHKTRRDNLLVVFDLLKRKNKLFPELPKLYKGSQWIGITVEFRNYMFEYFKKNPKYSKAFQKSLCGDELFFQTLVMNSPFRNQVYKTNELIGDSEKALRYIDWETGPDSPRTLDVTDIDKIILFDQECFFARKISHDLSLEELKHLTAIVAK